MTEEILINITSREARVALLENDVLQEVFIERTSRRGLVGNIYNGRVSRVLPGMQAAFVDIGFDRKAFLHASDIVPKPGKETSSVEVEIDIRELIEEGSDVLVQVLKDPLGTKGALLTTQIAIPSRYLVMMPHSDRVGVSSRIKDDVERERLRQCVESLVDTERAPGYIVRTAAEGEPIEALRGDMLFLEELWLSIEEDAKKTGPGKLVHEDLSLAIRVLRDLSGSETVRLRVDSDSVYAKMRRFANQFVPDISQIIERYAGERPIFDLFDIEDEIHRALQRKVPLKSGGYLVFDQTEAMTTIDVNTGAYVGHRNFDETIFRTNLEAAVAITRQLRLRNLGGIIIIDFIDMSEEEHRYQLFQTLLDHFASDSAKTQIMPLSPLGLIEMTRKRNRESLEQVLCHACPCCEGSGFIKTSETVCSDIFREILREYSQSEFRELLVLARSDVIERLLDEESTSVAKLQELTGSPIRLQSKSFCAPDQFDVVLM
ncbi:MAG: ribonuclease G [Candidatus Rariloculaceae bacterium]